jgi:hypothetical protein
MVLLASGLPLAALPPVNDTCAGAVVVPAAGPFPHLTPVVEVSCAGTAGDPAVLPDCGDTNATRSVWYRFTPAAAGTYVLSIGADTATDFGGEDITDTVLAVYTAPGCSGPFTRLACNDDSGLLQSALALPLQAGMTYYAVAWVGANSLLTNQALQVQLRVSQALAPPADTCAGAEVIPAAGPFPYLTAVMDTAGAGDAGDPTAACASFRGVWYRFTPAVAGTYIFSTDTDTATTIYDTSMGMFSSSGGCAGTFTALDCVDDLGSRLRSSLTRTLSAGATVYLVVWDYEATPIYGETALQLRVSLVGPPTVVTQPATGVAATSAVLNAAVAMNNLAGRFFFEWGTTTNYGSTTPSRLIGSALGVAQSRAETLTGLTPGITYQYRAVGSNAQGKVFGENRSLVLNPTPPQLGEPHRCPGGTFHLLFQAVPGQLYVMQGSSNLAQWIDLGPARDLGGGAFDYLHNPGMLPPYRFYKVRVR